MFSSKSIRYRLILIGTMCMLGLSACTSNNASAESVSNAVNSKNEKIIKENSDDTHREDQQGSDLLYREYQIGSPMEAGDIRISKEVIEESIENPEAVVIFYNDQILKTIPYEGEDLFFCLEKAGWYCIAIIEGEKMIDVSEKVSSFENVEDNFIIPLE